MSVTPSPVASVAAPASGADLVRALADAYGVPARPQSVAHRLLRRLGDAGVDPAVELARALLDAVPGDEAAAAAAWLEQARQGRLLTAEELVGDVLDEEALAEAEEALALRRLDLDAARPVGTAAAAGWTLAARRRVVDEDGTHVAWTYRAERGDGATAVVLVPTGGLHGPVAPGSGVAFLDLTACHPPPEAPEATHRARGAVRAEDVAAAADAAERAVAERRAVEAVALAAGPGTPLAFLAADALDREATGDGRPAALTLVEALRSGVLRGEAAPLHRRRWARRAAYRAARAYVRRMGRRFPRADLVEDVAGRFPQLAGTDVAALVDEALAEDAGR